MSDEAMGKNYESGLRFMMHVFYCRECAVIVPFNSHALVWWKKVGIGKSEEVADWREADIVTGAGNHALCDEGFELVKRARDRGWGA